MKNHLNIFSITALALVITVSFISCADLFFEEPKIEEQKKKPIGIFIPENPDPISNYTGAWATKEKDGIVKEVEILSDQFIERTYLNGEVNTQKRYVKTYYSSPYYDIVGRRVKIIIFPDSENSDDIEFYIQNNELTLGGGDIRYKGNNNSLKGEWYYDIETYRFDITFVPFNENSGTITFKLTLKPPHSGWLGFSFYYSIKNDNTLVIKSGDWFNGKIMELIDGKLHTTNRFVQNRQIKEYNEAHTENQLRCEMFELWFNWTGENKDDLYSFFYEEYSKK